ncbi:hypothetical protein [Endozoicomonas atrinae]|uniref:hypothetical protein n=1 Tax=Endozoicomonas atrinae TaxID=1333660 RepID=UPI003B00715C
MLAMPGAIASIYPGKDGIAEMHDYMDAGDRVTQEQLPGSNFRGMPMDGLYAGNAGSNCQHEFSLLNNIGNY